MKGPKTADVDDGIRGYIRVSHRLPMVCQFLLRFIPKIKSDQSIWVFHTSLRYYLTGGLMATIATRRCRSQNRKKAPKGQRCRSQTMRYRSLPRIIRNWTMFTILMNTQLTNSPGITRNHTPPLRSYPVRNHQPYRYRIAVAKIVRSCWQR